MNIICHSLRAGAYTCRSIKLALSTKPFAGTSDACFMVSNIRAITPPLTSFPIHDTITVKRSIGIIDTTVYSWWGRWFFNAAIFISTSCSIITLTSLLSRRWVGIMKKSIDVKFIIIIIYNSYLLASQWVVVWAYSAVAFARIC